MAILHVLLNINDSTVVGPRISSYKDFFDGISSDIRGETIAQQHDLLEINNSYEMHHPITFDIGSSSKEVRPAGRSHIGQPLLCVHPLLEGSLPDGRPSLRTCDHGCLFRSVLTSRQLRQRVGVSRCAGERAADAHSGDRGVAMGDSLDRRDDPATNSVAILIVHESFLAQYKRELEEEQRLVAQLKGEEGDSKSEEIAMHEVRVARMMECRKRCSRSWRKSKMKGERRRSDKGKSK